MLVPLARTHDLTAITNAKSETIQVVSPTALRCDCGEFAVNGFCVHLVYYLVAKIAAQTQRAQREVHPERSRREVILLSNQSAEK